MTLKTNGQYEQRRELIAKGSYAKKQILCKDRVVSWSHRSRFDFGCELVEQYAGGRFLDYGFGDGTFLAMVSHLFDRAVGVDPDEKQVAECTERFAGIRDLSFLAVDQISGNEHTGQYDLIVCMEVMEHCLPDILERVLNDLRRLVKADGTVIISVPVEIGPTLLSKQLLRRAAALRNLGDYKYFEKYSLRDFLKMFFAGKKSSIERPIYFADNRLRTRPFHGHKGFNWRALKLMIEKKFLVERMEFSPVGWSRGYFSSQAWFICKPMIKPDGPGAA